MTGYIYKITNTINNKIYVGQTVQTIEQRWMAHKRPSVHKNKHTSPLYNAMNKYGIDNFSIHLVEELIDCTIEQLNQREIYWIEHYHSYSNGYNATLGGETGCKYNYDEIAEFLFENNNGKEAMEKFGCCRDVINTVKTLYKIPMKNTTKRVNQYDKNDIFIQEFLSLSDACRWLEKQGITTKASTSNLSKVCNNERGTSYGYKWQWIKEF